MRKISATLIAALGLILSVGSFAQAVDLYVLTNSSPGGGDTSTNFGKVDSDTGAFTLINTITSDPDTWNLAWNPYAGNFFVTTDMVNNSTLKTLSTSGVITSSIGTIGKTIYGMAYRTVDTSLYAFTNDGDATGTINTSTGAWTELNPNPQVVAGAPIGGHYSIMNDKLYMSAYNNNNPGYGYFNGFSASSYWHQVKFDNNIENMALANDGTTMFGLYSNGVSGDQQLFTIDPDTGNYTAGPKITGAGLGLNFHGAAAITNVPEPSTYVLGAIATGMMTAVARRRKRNA